MTGEKKNKKKFSFHEHGTNNKFMGKPPARDSDALTTELNGDWHELAHFTRSNFNKYLQTTTATTTKT